MPLDNRAPGMGVTYRDLAGMRKPEIPGAGLRVGLSGLAGWNYGRDEQAYKQSLSQLEPMAEQDMQLKQQGANEYMAGAPLRGAMQEDAMSALGTKRKYSALEEEAKVADLIAKLAEAKRKKFEAAAPIFAEIADAAPEAVPEIVERYADRLPPNFAKGSPEAVKARASGVIKGLDRVGKMGLQQEKNKSYQQVNQARLDAQERRDQKQREHDRAMKNLQEAGKDGRLVKSLANIKSIEAKIIAIQEDEDLSPDEKKKQIEEWAAIKKSMQKEPPPTISLTDMISGKGKSKEPVKSADKFVKGKTYTNPKGQVAEYLGDGKWKLIK